MLQILENLLLHRFVGQEELMLRILAVEDFKGIDLVGFEVEDFENDAKRSHAKQRFDLE